MNRHTVTTTQQHEIREIRRAPRAPTLLRWCTSHQPAGARQPGCTQCSSRSTTARRCAALTVRAGRPRSSTSCCSSSTAHPHEIHTRAGQWSTWAPARTRRSRCAADRPAVHHAGARTPHRRSPPAPTGPVAFAALPTVEEELRELHQSRSHPRRPRAAGVARRHLHPRRHPRRQGQAARSGRVPARGSRRRADRGTRRGCCPTRRDTRRGGPGRTVRLRVVVGELPSANWRQVRNTVIRSLTEHSRAAMSSSPCSSRW